MATRLLAPRMGESVEEVTIVSWLKHEGDEVKELEVIVELETDKVTTDIPSPASGTILKILANENETVKVGTTLAWIGKPGETLESSPVEKPVETAAPAPVEKSSPEPETVGKAVPVIPQPAPAPSGKAVYISPLVKKIAALNNLDLNLVKGTGLDGRITKEDVEAYLERSKSQPGAPSSIPTQTVSAAPAAAAPAENIPILPGEMIPNSSIRRQIAERMVKSMHTSPHVLTVMEADLTKVLAHQMINKPIFADKGIHLTLTAYFCSAIVNALLTSPDVNSSWTDEGIIHHREINLGIATSLGDAGLIVPVIRDAASLSFFGLAQRINDLASRARAKKLLPDEVKDGTFTLTNHGSGGSLFASPIIFQPQAAILGTGMMQKRPVVITDANGNDSIAIRPMIYLSLVFDHRLLDGAGADAFLKKVKDALENWA